MLKKYWPILVLNIILVPLFIVYAMYVFPPSDEKIYEEPSNVNQLLLQDLNLPDCELTRTSAEHRHPDNRAVYALDIHCKPYGESMNIYAPAHYHEYTVYDVGFHAEGLGDYVVLQYGEQRYVFGHTKANKDIVKGKVVHPKDVIGMTTLTGKTTGYHMHYEVWVGEDNVSPGFSLGFDYSTNQAYSKIILEDQRKWDWSEKQTNIPQKEYLGQFNLSRYYTVIPGQKRYYLNRTYEEDFEENCDGDCFVPADNGLLSDADWGKVAACPPNIPLGSKLLIEGLGEIICRDRGGAIKGKRLDIYMGVGDAGVDRLYAKVTTYGGARQVYLLH